MTCQTRLIICVIGLSLFCGTASAADFFFRTYNYAFDKVNGKVLPIPSDVPEVCQASVSGWPFVGFALGGIYLPPQPSPIAAVVDLRGQNTFARAGFGNFCLNDGFKIFVNFCIGTDLQPCPRVKFLIKTKEAVMGDRG